MNRHVSLLRFHPMVAAEWAEVLSNAEVNGEYRHLFVACGELAAAALRVSSSSFCARLHRLARRSFVGL